MTPSFDANLLTQQHAVWLQKKLETRHTDRQTVGLNRITIASTLLALRAVAPNKMKSRKRQHNSL